LLSCLTPNQYTAVTQGWKTYPLRFHSH